MILREEIIEIGVYNKSHGVSGELSATFLCDAQIVDRFSCLISEIDGLFVPFFVEASRGKSDSSRILKLCGIDTEADAKSMSNNAIFVKKSEYDTIQEEEDCDEFPLDYFIGYTVKDEDLGRVGEIVDVDDSTENVLFVVDLGNDKEAFIPAADEIITNIDQDNKILTFQLPEGLLNL